MMRKQIWIGFISVVLLLGASGVSLAKEDFRTRLSEKNAEKCGVAFPTTARATLKIRHQLGKTRITIKVKHAAPHEFFTIWLLLDDISPLTPGGAFRFTPSCQSI